MVKTKETVYKYCEICESESNTDIDKYSDIFQEYYKGFSKAETTRSDRKTGEVIEKQTEYLVEEICNDCRSKMYRSTGD